MTWIKRGFLALFVLILSAVIILWTPDSDRDAMIAKYGGNEANWATTQDQQRIHFRDQGKMNGTPIILVHGSNSSLHTWEKWVHELSTTYRVITLDLPGHGLSGAHPHHDYSADAMIEAVDAVVRQLDLDSFILAGNSMGGWVTWRYALQFPEKLKAMILVDAAGAELPKSAQSTLPIGFRIIQTPGLNQLAAKLTPRFLIARSLEQSISAEQIISNEMIDRYWELLRFPGNRAATIKRFQTDRDVYMAQRLGEISIPTLILWGEEDTLIPVEAAHIFNEILLNNTLIIYENTGHLPMEEIAQESARDVQQFLERVIE